MEMDEEEKAEEAQKAEDFKRLQEEVAAAKPKGTVRAGPPQIERLVQPSVKVAKLTIFGEGCLLKAHTNAFTCENLYSMKTLLY